MESWSPWLQLPRVGFGNKVQEQNAFVYYTYTSVNKTTTNILKIVTMGGNTMVGHHDVG